MGGIVETVVVVLALSALGATLWVLFSRERKARRRYRILSETAAVSDAGGSLEDTIEAICDILVPDFADFCMIDLFDEDGEVTRAGLRVSPGGGEPEPRQGLAARRPSIPDRMIEGDDGPSLKPRFFERMTDRDLEGLADGPEDLEFLSSLGCRSAITVALNARGADHRRADPRRGLVGPALHRRGRPLRLGPLRQGRARARQLRPLRRSRAGRAGPGRDRRDPAARPAAAAASPHPGLVGRRDVPAGGVRERGRRRLLRRLPRRRRLDAGSRRRHRPRRPRRLADGRRPLHPPHRRDADRGPRPGAGDPQSRPLRPRRLIAVQRGRPRHQRGRRTIR